MALNFDDASSQRLSRTAIGPSSVSLWFYPDDSALDCTIISEHPALSNTRGWRLWIDGSISDQLKFENFSTTSTAAVSSVGTVNYNAWNHAYFVTRGVVDNTKIYLSLNGETLQSSTYIAPGAALTNMTLGAHRTVSYFSGRIAEVACWDYPLSDSGIDWYGFLSQGGDPRQNPGPGGGINLISYSQLIGNATDLVVGGTPWGTGSAGTFNVAHPRIFRPLEFAA